MNKSEQLRNTAEGLLAGLVAIGFEDRWKWAHHQWEGAFYRAWSSWPPAENTGVFRVFRVGGSPNGRTSQAREVLFSIKSTSPFAGYNRAPLNPSPRGLAPEEYLETWVEGATPKQWMDLARAFLNELGEPTA